MQLQSWYTILYFQPSGTVVEDTEDSLGYLGRLYFKKNGLKKTIAFFKFKLLRSDSESNWGNKEYKHLKFRGDS